MVPICQGRAMSVPSSSSKSSTHAWRTYFGLIGMCLHAWCYESLSQLCIYTAHVFWENDWTYIETLTDSSPKKGSHIWYMSISVCMQWHASAMSYCWIIMHIKCLYQLHSFVNHESSHYGFLHRNVTCWHHLGRKRLHVDEAWANQRRSGAQECFWLCS